MIRTLPDLAAALPKGARLLGLDLGTKTIGLAVCDPGLTVASPIQTIHRSKFTEEAKELAKIVRDYGVGGFVLGLPLNMDGSQGPRAQATNAFAATLGQRADLFGGWEPQIAFWDERLSTVAVQRFMTDEADMTRKRRGEVVDKMAAAYILQGAIDSLSYARRQAEEAAARDARDYDDDRDD
jgi:putative Holliday junction resolvase